MNNDWLVAIIYLSLPVEPDETLWWQKLAEKIALAIRREIGKRRPTPVVNVDTQLNRFRNLVISEYDKSLGIE